MFVQCSFEGLHSNTGFLSYQFGGGVEEPWSSDARVLSLMVWILCNDLIFRGGVVHSLPLLLC